MPMRDDRGMALVVVAMTMLLVMAVGAGLALTTSSEALIAGYFRASEEALYAADAAAEWASIDLAAVVDDWPTLLNTPITSSFVDGAAGGWRTLPDGSPIDVGAVVRRNASWKPYAYGLLKDLLPPPALSGAGSRPSGFYVVILVAADSSASDRLNVRAEALGPRGTHKTIDMSMLRDAGGIRPVAWAETR